MLTAFEAQGCNKRIKVNFLHSHVKYFPENLETCSEEHGKRFHQNIITMEKYYQIRFHVNMMAGYY